MPKFCANLTMLFNEVPLMERFGAAKSAGFDTVEVLFPYDHAVPDMLDMLGRNGLTLALINCPPPNYTGGDRGFAAVPGLEARFRQDFKRTLRYAKALGARHIHVMAGVASGEAARQTFVENLGWAAAEAGKMQLLIEPLNHFDMPGYFLTDCDQAVEIIAEVGAKNLALQFDAYHVQRMTGDMMAVWARVRGAVKHVQIGQTPDRSDPVDGEIDFLAFFAQLDRDGYKGWVSGEYTPKGTTEAGLSWMS